MVIFVVTSSSEIYYEGDATMVSGAYSTYEKALEACKEWAKEENAELSINERTARNGPSAMIDILREHTNCDVEWIDIIPVKMDAKLIND